MSRDPVGGGVDGSESTMISGIPREALYLKTSEGVNEAGCN
jgi:hypothetical protein